MNSKIEYFKRAVRFFLFHIYKNPSYLFTYARHFFDSKYTFSVNYFATEEFAELVKSGKSVIRIGDGEVYYLNYGGLPAQVFDEKLRSEMHDALKNYSATSPYVIGFNKVPLQTTNKKMRKHNLLHSWLPVKVYYDLHLKNKLVKYFDASVFYYNDTIPVHFESFLLNKHIILVSNASNIAKFKSNTTIPFPQVSFVETPAIHSYEAIDTIQESVLELVSDKKQTVVLAACGPTSKALAYRFAQIGLLTIDIGTGMEIAYTDTRIDFMANPFSDEK